MARIRTIKPEILTDEKTAALSDTEWRLFVSCIAMADDYGNFRASPAFIHSQAFWSSSTTREDSRKALENVASVSLIKLYVVEGQQYGHITGWEKHQRVDHPGKPLCPFPTDSRASRESSRNSREEIAQVSDITSSRDSRETLAPEGEKEEEKEVGIGKGGDAPARVATGGPIRPRTAHDLEHCLRVAIEREQPKNGPWNPGGSFAAKEAREFLEGFKDLEAALETIERRIDLFAKDPAMQPWTIAKFAKSYNGIGQPKRDDGRKGAPSPAIYPKFGA